MNPFFHKKPLPAPSHHNKAGQLLRTIGLPALLLMGVGSTLGTGIFFVLTETAPLAGPAVIISFLLAAFAAGLTALCYAEVAGAIPVAGSSYTFAYMTMGQGIAVLVGACLALEWGVAAAAVAVGWSQYLNEAILLLTGIEIPENWRASALQSLSPDEGPAHPIHYGNFPAMIMVWLCTLLLLKGSRQSTAINAVLTLCKIAILALFVIMVLPAFQQVHLHPFAPAGMTGVSQAAAIVFFSFVGLDSIVTASEEAIRPEKNIPRAIVGALVIVTVIYLIVVITGLGAQPAAKFAGQSAGLAEILLRTTTGSTHATILSVGAVVSIFSVTLIALYGQARVYFAMARDRVLPAALGRINQRSGTPQIATIASACVVTPMAGFLPSKMLWGMVSIGTLMAFIAVSVALIILRRQQPQLKRDFKAPLYPLTPVLSILCCLYLIASLDHAVHLAFVAWVSIVMAVYGVHLQLRRRNGLVLAARSTE